MVSTDKDTTREHDGRARRCPMLGHNINFAYCRAPGRELPCQKVFDCWWEAFDVETFLREQYSDDEIEAILAPRTGKVASIVELIRLAQSRKSSPE